VRFCIARVPAARRGLKGDTNTMIHLTLAIISSHGPHALDTWGGISDTWGGISSKWNGIVHDTWGGISSLRGVLHHVMDTWGGIS
jgi:hypothetical protein